MRFLPAWLRSYLVLDALSGRSADDLAPGRKTASMHSIRLRLGTLVLLCLLLLAVSLFPTIKTYLQTVAILIDVNGSRLPRVLHPVLDQNVTSRKISIHVANGQPIAAILYTPEGHRNAPGLVIVHGLDPGGMESLNAYARLEASTGLRVLTPDISPLKTYSVGNINISDVKIIGESAKWLARETGRPATLMGVSFSGGLALVAASKEEYASSIRLVFDVGGYDNLPRVIEFYRTGIDTGPNGEITQVRPSRWVRYFLEYTDLVELGTREDISALEPILKLRIIDAAHHPRGADENISRLLAKLSPEETHKLDLLLDRKNNEADLARLIDKTRLQMQEVSPHGNLEGLIAPVYILHGLDDDVIPSEEALWLRQDLAQSGKLRRIVISPLVSHVSIQGNSITWKDKWSLVYFMYAVHGAMLDPYSGSKSEKVIVWLARIAFAIVFPWLLLVIGYLARAHFFKNEKSNTAVDDVRCKMG